MTGGVERGCVTVFGGSGFLGAGIVQRLAAAGFSVRVAARRPEAYADGAARTRGQVVPVRADVQDEASVADALAGADAAVNAVGLYVEGGADSFKAVHEDGALTVARMAAAQGVARLVHFSGIGADPASVSKYLSARGRADRMVRDACPEATILRPSAVFAPNDRFINMLADIARMSPVLPLFGRGHTRLQPVFLGDVAEAVLRALADPAAAAGTYELGGARSYTYRELIELVLARCGRRRLLLPVPFVLWDMLAALASLLPNPPFTEAQVNLMRADNVVAADALSFKDLGITPTALEDVLAEYDL